MKYKFDDIAFNSTAKKQPTDADKERYIGLEHLDSGTFVVSRWGAEAAPVGEKLVMKKGDVLFGKRRAYQKKVAIAPFDGIFSAHGMVLRPKEAVVDARFFPHFIASDYFLREAIRISVGGLSPTINWKDLKALEFSLPPIEEQRRLADLLWAANDLKEAYKRAIVASDEMLKAKFREMFGDPIKNTMHWPQKPLKEVAPESPSTSKPDGEKVWLLNLDEIESNTGKITQKDFVDNSELGSVQAFDTGNVLYSKLRPYLNKVVIPDESGYACTELIPLRPKENVLNKEFLCALLQLDEFVKYANDIANGTKMPRMPMNALRTFMCILPPITKQETYIRLRRQSKQTKSLLELALNDLTATIKGIVNQALEG